MFWRFRRPRSIARRSSPAWMAMMSRSTSRSTSASASVSLTAGSRIAIISLWSAISPSGAAAVAMVVRFCAAAVIAPCRPDRRSGASSWSTARGRMRRAARHSVACRRMPGIRWRASSWCVGQARYHGSRHAASQRPPLCARQLGHQRLGTIGRSTRPNQVTARRRASARATRSAISRSYRASPNHSASDRGRVCSARARGDLLGIQPSVALGDIGAVQAQQPRREPSA